jgi:hypothetical protein
MEKYNLVGNNAPTSSTIMLAAMIPFLRVNRPVQSIERVSNGIQNPFVSMRRIFQDIVTVFRGINREHEKQGILLDRAEREDDEQRQERINVIRRDGEKIEEEQETPEAPQSTGISNLVTITNILSRLSGIIRALRRLSIVALSLAGRLARFIIFAIRLVRALRFLRGVPLYGRAIRLAFGVAAGTALERLLEQTNFNERADRLESELERFGQGMTTQMQPGAPVRAEGGVRGTEAAAMNFFMNNGFTREQAAGIVGNLIQESRLDPRAHNMRNNENSQGIAQWNPARGRQQRVADYLGKPILQASFEEQLRAVLWELNGNERHAGDLLRRATTAEQAASIIMNHYERPHRDHGNLPARVGHARRLSAPQPASNGPSIPNSQPGVTSGGASGPVSGVEQNERHSLVQPNVIGSTQATRTVAASNQNTINRHIHFVPILIG